MKKEKIEGKEVLMKRSLLLMMALVLVVSVVAGCGAEAKTYIDPEETITVKVGEVFIILLDRDAGGGFQWLETFDQAFLKMVKQEYESGFKEEGLTGPGGTQYYHFKGVKAGNTEIDLEYRREREAKYMVTFKVTITE